jgi:predicted dehydrogenase
VGHRAASRKPAATVALIGCGRVGSQWDEDRPAGTPALTHAAAFQRASRASLVALCDPDPERLASAARARGVSRQYTSSAALFGELVPDIAIIATPTAVRREPIEAALQAGVATLVCEKTIASSLEEGRELAERLGSAKVFINYLRRWDKAMRDWRARIARGELGKLQRAVGWYGKGLFNNGTHLIDLVLFLAGASALRARAGARRLDSGEADWNKGADPTFDAEVVFPDFVLTLLGTDHRHATVFELDLLGTDGRLRISEGGRRLEAWAAKSDPVTPGYRVLQPARAGEPGLQHAMETLAEEAVSASLGENVTPMCAPQDALASLAIADAIRRSAAAGGAWQDIQVNR